MMSTDTSPQDESFSANKLPEQSLALPDEGIDLKQYLESIEKALISDALDKTGFVVARAAAMLMIRRTTLVEKMRKYGIQRQLDA